MPDIKFSELVPITVAEPNDLVTIIDRSDQSMSVNGSNKIISVLDLSGSIVNNIIDNTSGIFGTAAALNSGTIAGTVPVLGAEGKLAASRLPDSLLLDYITLEESGEAILPRGTLTRVGDELRMVNLAGVAQPVAPNNTATVENIIPYRRVSGTKILFPFGTTGYVGKTAPNGTVHYTEIARIKIPGADVYAGQVLTLQYSTALKMPVGVAAVQGWKTGLVPANFWDAVPFSSIFNTPTNNSPFHNGHFINGNSSNVEHSVINQVRTATITFNEAGQIVFENPQTSVREGYVFAPVPATQSVFSIGSNLQANHVPYTDLEFVWFAQATTDTAKYAVLEFTLEADMAPAKPAAPVNLVGAVAGASSAQLNWTDSSDIETGFEIWRTGFSNLYYSKIGQVAAGVTTYIDSDYPFSMNDNVRTTGFYRVRAVNGRTPSDFSNEVSVTPA